MAKKKHALLYVGCMFAGALVVVALSLLLKLYVDMDRELDDVKQQLSTVQTETLPEDRALRATELLVLAQDAYHKGDKVSFHAYMAMLDGYADELSEKTREIYEILHDKLSQ